MNKISDKSLREREISSKLVGFLHGSRGAIGAIDAQSYGNPLAN
jgi:hypothetical protein